MVLMSVSDHEIKAKVALLSHFSDQRVSVMHKVPSHLHAGTGLEEILLSFRAGKVPLDQRRRGYFFWHH